ncbi:hypothetical protein BCEN4_370142 [Burkholderia cenocepacia]|nr:hypothetical protein BCEN4_370142 [Burkholderia cenocepacia]
MFLNVCDFFHLTDVVYVRLALTM